MHTKQQMEVIAPWPFSWPCTASAAPKRQPGFPLAPSCLQSRHSPSSGLSTSDDRGPAYPQAASPPRTPPHHRRLSTQAAQPWGPRVPPSTTTCGTHRESSSQLAAASDKPARSRVPPQDRGQPICPTASWNQPAPVSGW